MGSGIEILGDFNSAIDWMKSLSDSSLMSDLDNYGAMGVSALEAATPVATGLAASSWDYEITADSYGPVINWINTDDEGGYNVIILLQYGHATKSGGYVEGEDFINPAMRPVFDYILADIRKKVNP